MYMCSPLAYTHLESQVPVRNPVTNHKFIAFVNTLSSGENESTKQGHGRLLARSICCLANRYKNAVLDIISSVVFIL